LVPGGDEYELVVTHDFLAGWLVSQAMAAPPWRWLRWTGFPPILRPDVPSTRGRE
jgi:hypothetical protein